MIAALLGAEEFAFSTAPLVAAGCVMMRVCHLNTCPVGIATQDPELRRRFTGTPEHVVTYFMHLAEGVRQELAELGARSLDELVGRADLLAGARPSGLDLSALIHPAPGRSGAGRRRSAIGVARCRALAAGRRPRSPAATRSCSLARLRNTDRSVGAFLAGEIARRRPGGCPPTRSRCGCTGHAGQSLARLGAGGPAHRPRGRVQRLRRQGPVRRHADGAAVRAAPGMRPSAACWSATRCCTARPAGEAYLRGRAGERFAVRNSGATAVVEGVGDHGCEYMTGGVVVILGARRAETSPPACPAGSPTCSTPGASCRRRLNPESVDLEPLDADDLETVIDLLHRHFEATGSPVATRILAGWAAGADGVVLQGDAARPAAVQARRQRAPRRRWSVPDPRGFLEDRRAAPRTTGRWPSGWRPAASGHRFVRRSGARAGDPLHGLRRAVLPHRLPARPTRSPTGTTSPGAGCGPRRPSSCTRPTTSPSSPAGCVRRRARRLACSR